MASKVKKTQKKKSPKKQWSTVPFQVFQPPSGTGTLRPSCFTTPFVRQSFQATMRIPVAKARPFTLGYHSQKVGEGRWNPNETKTMGNPYWDVHGT